jgi:hypothetical protein
MLKPFPDRVNSTYRLLLTMLEETHHAAPAMGDARAEALRACATMQVFPVSWKADTTRFEMIPFKGYTFKQKPSDVTDRERGYYDRSDPWQRKIRFYDTYVPTREVAAPAFYVLPQAWHEVVRRLELNGIEMSPLSRDTVMKAEVYYIDDYQTTPKPYEGRYLHSDVKVHRVADQAMSFYKGDWLIPVNQPRARFVVETLEPEGVDSWFAWGFFDAVLQQKEWFSSYVFEDKAAKLLESPGLRASFEEKMKSDTAFAANAFSQLYFIYRNSPDFEKTLNRYPVARIPRQ